MTQFNKGDLVWVTLSRHDPMARWWKAKVWAVHDGNPPAYEVRITEGIMLEAADHIVARSLPYKGHDGWIRDTRPDGL